MSIEEEIIDKSKRILRDKAINDKMTIKEYRRAISFIRFNDRLMKVILSELEHDGFLKRKQNGFIILRNNGDIR